MWIKKSKYEEMQNELRRLHKIEKTNRENLIAWSDESRKWVEYKEAITTRLEKLLTTMKKRSVYMEDVLKQLRGLDETRCKECNKLLGYINGNYEIKCPRCGEMNVRKENVKDDI